MTRKLVTIRRIKDILPIAGADRIELIIVDGWQVVAQKEAGHQVGDLVLYFEIDSFLPDTDPRYASFEERFSNWGDKRGMRLKTIKLRKQLSQGLVMRLPDFPEAMAAIAFVKADVRDGTLAADDSWENIDVTEALGIEKWEPIEKASRTNMPGSSEGKRFPSFIRKTDQERIQNYGPMVQRAVDADENFEISMKKDGSSLTVFRVDPKSAFYADAKALVAKKEGLLARIQAFITGFFLPKEAVYGICSRNVLLKLDGDSNFHKAVATFGLLDALEEMDGSFALQGEVVAPDIQDNHEKVDSVEFHLFDIFDIDKQEYLLPEHRESLAFFYDIPHVTVLEHGVTLKEALGIVPTPAGTDVVKAALAYAEGPGDNPGVQREGVVFKSCTRDFSFKAVSDSYLLKKG
jgi:RNA ligase (TIGR02306 family)